MSRFRFRTAVLGIAAAFLAIAGGTAIGGAAYAAPRCGIINIGNPGNVTEHGVYAGQVEQEYNTCNGFTFAHFQWSGNFQSWFAFDSVQVAIYDTNGNQQWTGPTGVNVKATAPPSAEPRASDTVAPARFEPGPSSHQ